MREIDSRYVYEDQRHIARQGPPFDRVGYAMRLLRILRPEGLSVAVREGRWELRVDRGRDWAGRAGDQWAVLSIPPDADRRAIALAIAELAGVERSPFVLETLLGADEPH